MRHQRPSGRTALYAALAGLSLTACGPEPSNLGQGLSPVTVDNGIQLNGIQLNGLKLNGLKLNGVKLNGVKLNGVKLNGVKLNGSALGGVDAAGRSRSGAALRGATLEGALSNGTTLALRIEKVRAGSEDNEDNEDVTYYVIGYQGDAGWEPLCGRDAAGSAISAVALVGTWNDAQGVPGGGAWTNDPSALTFACTNAALGKCVEWGYKPWATFTRCTNSGCVRTPLGPYHRACARLVRADYCGDGRSWTVDGTRVNVFDALALNRDTETWVPEAEWDENGALCVGSTRILTTAATFAAAASCGAKTVSECGSKQDFHRGALLISECVNNAMLTAATVNSSPISYQ